MTTPALPPGFVLEQPQASAAPPLPAGFEMIPDDGGMPITDLPAVQAEMPDFSDVAATTATYAPAAPRATDDMSGLDRFRSGVGKSMVDTAHAIAQMSADQAMRPVAKLSEWASRINPEAAAQAEQAIRTPQNWLRQLAAERRDQDQDLMDTTGGTAGKIGGDIATLLIPGSAAARAPTMLGRVAGNAAVGAAGGSLQPVESEHERKVNAAYGAIFGTAGGAVGEGLGALSSRAKAAIDPTRKRLMELAEKSGIPLHISQVSESLPLKTLASAAKYLPFGGAGKAAQRQQEAFNRAVGKTFGADAPKLTDEVMSSARQRISDAYETIYARTDIPISPEAVRELVAVETAASKRLIQPQIEVLRNQMDLILDEAAATGALTGRKYQALRTEIMKAEDQTALGGAVKDLRKAMDNIAERSASPEDVVALRRLRSQWANMKTVQGVLQQVAGATENVNPARLWSAIRNGSTKEMRDFARLGQTILKDPVPDSGTASRNVAYGLLTGSGMFGGAAAIPGMLGTMAAGAAAGRALNSNALARLASNPGNITGALSKAAPSTGLAAVPLVVREPERFPDGNVSKPRLQKRR